MTNHTTDLRNKIQEFNNLLKNGYLTRNSMWEAFWGTMCASIKYVLPVTTLSNIEASNMTVYLHRETI